MSKQHKEQLSSFMDGNYCELQLIKSVAINDELQQYWHRCHVIRDAMQGKLHDSALTLDISHSIAAAIELDDLYDQNRITEFQLPKTENLFWVRIKDVIGKVGQVGLAACVTLAVIAGVQYQQTSTDNTPVLNTMPMGVNISPVGGAPIDTDEHLSNQTKLDQQQYNKIRLLIQDYELQKRLSVQ